MHLECFSSFTTHFHNNLIEYVFIGRAKRSDEFHNTIVMSIVIRYDIFLTLLQTVGYHIS